MLLLKPVPAPGAHWDQCKCLDNVCTKCPHPSVVIFTPLSGGSQVSLQLWGCAVHAAVPGLLQHCSSSAASRQLPEIKGKTSQGANPFSSAHWCPKPQCLCQAELPRDGISRVGQSEGLWLCRCIWIESQGKQDFFLHFTKCLQCQVSAQSPA